MQDLGVLQELVSPDDAAGVYRKVAIHDLQKFGLPGLLIAIALGGGAGVPAVLGGTDAPLGTAIGIAALAAAVVIYVFQLLINTRLAEGEARAIENRVQMVLDLAGSITAAWMESRDKTLSRDEASAFIKDSLLPLLQTVSTVASQKEKGDDGGDRPGAK